MKNIVGVDESCAMIGACRNACPNPIGDDCIVRADGTGDRGGGVGIRPVLASTRCADVPFGALPSPGAGAVGRWCGGVAPP